MKKKKRLIATALAGFSLFGAALGLSACGDGKENKDSLPEDPTKQEQTIQEQNARDYYLEMQNAEEVFEESLSKIEGNQLMYDNYNYNFNQFKQCYNKLVVKNVNIVDDMYQINTSKENLTRNQHIYESVDQATTLYDAAISYASSLEYAINDYAIQNGIDLLFQNNYFKVNAQQYGVEYEEGKGTIFVSPKLDTYAYQTSEQLAYYNTGDLNIYDLKTNSHKSEKQNSSSQTQMETLKNNLANNVLSISRLEGSGVTYKKVNGSIIIDNKHIDGGFRILVENESTSQRLQLTFNDEGEITQLIGSDMQNSEYGVEYNITSATEKEYAKFYDSIVDEYNKSTNNNLEY